MGVQTHEHLSKLVVKCEGDEDGVDAHPHCPHGPTVLFYYEGRGPLEGYYGCSAYRDRRDCAFCLPAKEMSVKYTNRRYNLCTSQIRKLRDKFLRSSSEQTKHFCFSCNSPLIQNDLELHLDHDVHKNLSKKLLKAPTLFLRPLDNDKAQAQYFFDEKSLIFFKNTFRDLKISKVICMGAPRLHAYIISQCQGMISSFLLDLDHRFFYFYEDHQYAWFNMCNNHFFDDRQKQEFSRFLKCKSDDRLLLFTDPPFGCRTELIGNTLRKVTNMFNWINQLPNQPLPIFWVFPYFSVQYVQQAMPALQMSDYKINYTNHASYTDVGSKSRRLGSPVRLFTNVPLELLKLPVCEQYKYCSKCQKYTSLENRHCEKCKCCPSKNGSTYKHCDQCGLCVKPYYVHCRNCRRCVQNDGHNCLEYQSKQKCWICRSVGHTEHRCDYWRKKSLGLMFGSINSPNETFVEEEIICLMCSSRGHNELTCEKRLLFLNEVTFMGQSYIS